MFTTLMESRAPKTRRVGGTVVSALVHGALIAGAVALTTAPRVSARPVPPEPDHRVVFVPLVTTPVTPQPEGHGSVIPEATLYPPTIELRIVVPDLNRPMLIDFGPRRSLDACGDCGGMHTDRLPTATPGLPGDGQPWDAAIVDRSPSVVGRALEPRYPASLRDAGMEGRVVMQFVVDTTGRAEMGDLTVIEATRPQFAEAVRQVLPSYRFIPGAVSGRAVRTRVQLPFTFTITR